MKKIIDIESITTILLLLIAMENIAQNYRWEAVIGMSNRHEYISDLKECYDKGYYIEGNHRPLNNYNNRGYQIKTNVNGAILWDKTMIGNDYYVGIKSIFDENGNRYVSGVMINLTGNKAYPMVIKYNACGEKEWCRLIGDSSYNSGWTTGISLNKNNEIIVCLVFSAPSNTDRIYLAAFSTEGEFLWRNVYASITNHPVLRDVLIYDMLYHNNEYYLSGFCYYPYPHNPNHAFLRPFFVGIDSVFEEKWIMPFMALDSIFGHAMMTIPLNDSVLVATGHRRISNGANGLIMFYTCDGAEIGYCEINKEQIDPGCLSVQLKSIVLVNDTAFILTGLYEPVMHTFYGFEMVSSNSCMLSTINLRPNTAAWMPQLIKTSDNCFLIGTSRKLSTSGQEDILLAKFDQNLQTVPFDTATYMYDSLCPNSITSGNTDMSDCMVLIVGESKIPTPKEYYASIRTIPITIYPNPAKDQITFALENTEHHRNIELRCFNLLGVLQHQTKVQRGQQQASLNVSTWAAGMYVAVVYSDGKPVGRGKFVVRK